MDRRAVISLASGVTVIVATLIGVALYGPAGGAAAAAVVRGKLVDCPLAAVPVDSGYGFSSKALTPVCPAVGAGGR